MFGSVDKISESSTHLLKTVRKDDASSTAETGKYTTEVNGTTITLTNCTLYTTTGSTTTDESSAAYITGEFTPTAAMTIDVSANAFPGTYYVTGDTYARSENSSKDELTWNSSLAA